MSAAQFRRRVVVQRHSSWEHALLGDTPPQRLGEAAVTSAARKHVLADEWKRMMFFSRSPDADPRPRFPDVRWIQLRTSCLWVSYGELNALADYLPGPGAYDDLPREQILPVLQRMRSGVRAKAGAEFGLRGTDMAGMATHWTSYISEDIGEVKGLDEATASSGTDRYLGLVARNACHFAPFSWQRWTHFHIDARAAALAHHAQRDRPAPIKDVDRAAAEPLRQALLTNGYADHFLQDSFAAGHLVNKTLVMQWWVDFLNDMKGQGAGMPDGLPDADVMARMGSATQPGLAGRRLYTTPITRVGSASGDRELGDDVTDPQTAQERTDRERRVAGSGVVGAGTADREANYQAYLRFLNSGLLQAAAGSVHDHFNAIGLWVVNGEGTRLRIGGDDTLLGQSDQAGAQLAAQASHLSQRAIQDLLDTGSTDVTIERIFALVPQNVVAGDGVDVPLGEWQDAVVRELCFRTLFPSLFVSVKAELIGLLGPTMTDTGVSGDAGRAPAPAPKGDFPLPEPGAPLRA